jgi:RNA-directed DNA polymerase
MGVERRGWVVLIRLVINQMFSGRSQVSESKSSGKSFGIEKMLVKDSWERVRAKRGAAGVDGVSIVEFEADLKNNLYRIWNRMSSGTYFPPAVMAVEIPKAGGSGVRTLGVPTVGDRVAQGVVKAVLEPVVEPLFHADSFGYRPGRSPLDAVGVCRQRCIKANWVIDLDIKGFFDTVPHDLILRAVDRHTDVPWVRLYVRRWLLAPMRMSDGTLVARDRGTPQGSVISPLLANLFMHYAFDAWMAREHPSVQFERYCDDIVVHCGSKSRAESLLAAIDGRLGSVGLELHPEKTKIVYCKDGNRRDSYEHTEFTFLGYTFRARGARSRHGVTFTGFLPAVSKRAKKAMSLVMRSWRLGRRTELGFTDLARWINPIVAGWINHYGHFYRSELVGFLDRINDMLVRWLTRKYKRLRGSRKKARQLLRDVHNAYRGMFAHWRFGARPGGWTMGAV